MNKIGKIIKDQRLEKNITLKSLSDSTSISIGTLSNIENDKIKNPSGVFLYRISISNYDVLESFLKKYYIYYI